MKNLCPVEQRPFLIYIAFKNNPKIALLAIKMFVRGINLLKLYL